MSKVTIPPHLLPPNATPLEKVVMRAVLKQYAKHLIHRKRYLWDAEKCPVELLPWLAWTFGLEVWDNNWSEPIKRNRIKSAIPIARKKGTLGSINRLLNGYGGSSTIREWWQLEPKGRPHTFEIILNIRPTTGETVTAKELEMLLKDIDNTKPVRSHYTATQGLQARSTLPIAAAMRTVTSVSLKFKTEVKPTITAGGMGLCAIARTVVSVTLPFKLQ